MAATIGLQVARSNSGNLKKLLSNFDESKEKEGGKVVDARKKLS